MCGIFCFVSKHPNQPSPCESRLDLILDSLKRRGPDSFGRVSEKLRNGMEICCCASVLWTQGSTAPTKQPLIDSQDWSKQSDWGDIFNNQYYKADKALNPGGGKTFSDIDLGKSLAYKKEGECDSTVVSASMAKIGVEETLKSIQGPYSFVYLDKKNLYLWFGRDPLGRQSLLFEICDSLLHFSSVGCASIPHLKEVPALGIFKIDLEEKHFSKSALLYRWQHRMQAINDPIFSDIKEMGFQISQKIFSHSVLQTRGFRAKFPSIKIMGQNVVKCHEPNLTQAIRVGVTFGGNVGPADIVSLDFPENPEPDTTYPPTRVSISQTVVFPATVRSNLVENHEPVMTEPPTVISTVEDVGLSDLNTLEAFSSNETFKDNVDNLLTILKKAVQIRVNTQPNMCASCIKTNGSCVHAKTAILFSGGLDSTILALLCNEFVPESDPIDLFNVAFEKIVRTQNTQPTVKELSSESGINSEEAKSVFDVPDRISGRESLAELRALCPKRKWNFVEIDVKREELDEYRQLRISDLIFPLKSVLDDGLGCAVWFAARGQGLLDGEPYSSSARILILGMGADELLGGYSRHRRTFISHGWLKLNEELMSDVENIAFRNLGRDNRVTSDHGKQPRFPFLDENVVHFLTKLPPWHRCSLRDDTPPGFGDKLLLRLVALKLGLNFAATLKKKAIQFGSKIADSRENGNATCSRLLPSAADDND